MSVRLGRQKENENQQRDDNSQYREDRGGMPEEVVVDLHDDKHHGQTECRRQELLEREIIRIAELFLGDDGGRAEDHGDAKRDKRQRYDEQHSIRSEFLSHYLR